MIYFLQPVAGGPVKIGYSADVPGRHRQLESHYGQPLALLAMIEGSVEQEAEIHGRFAHLRLGRTEQFRPAAELMAFIGRPLLVHPDPEAVEAMPADNLRGLRPVRVDLTHEAHRLLRLIAADADMSMASYAREALTGHLKDEAKRRGIRP